MPTSPNSICPKCSTPIAAGAPQGICPKCVLLGVAATAATAKPRSAQSKAPSPQEIAPHFPELEVLELIGVGGMGAVYKARQTKLGRLVALKILSSSLAEDPEFLERFDREARVLGRLNHPGIVTVFDSGKSGPCAYLLMEFVDGVNLRQAMQSGGFTPREALAVTQEICSALEYAHGQGILHRDIKPENILIDSAGRVKIADFGIAKLVGDQGPDHATLTVRGAILGSMSYMAPEQFDAPGDVDQRADIYSLGVVLYELLTGELPRGRFGPPSEKSAVDARIDDIVMRTLEREREARFQNVHQMKTQVDAATQPGIAQAPTTESAPSRKTADAPIHLEQTMSRFSLLSALLTATSMIIGTIIAYLLFSFGDLDFTIRVIGAAWSIICFVTFFGTAFCGFILGLSALGTIRKSQGAKDGLPFAIFAVTFWPAILVSIFALGGISSFFAENGVATVWRNLLSALLLATSVLGVVMIRRFFRWTHDSSPASVNVNAHVWRFVAASVLAVACVFAYVREERATRAAYNEPSGTKVTWKLDLDAGTMIVYRVYRSDTKGNEKPLDIGGTIFAPVDRDFETMLEIVSTNRSKETPQQEIMVGYHALNNETYSRTVSLEEEWKFGTSAKGGFQLRDGGAERYELAKRYDWFGKKVESLYFEMAVTKQSKE